jgi:hypothetical protein
LGCPLELVFIVTGNGQFSLRLLQVLVEAAQPAAGIVSDLAGKDLGVAVGAA